MSTDLKSKTKEFINYLRSTDEYVTALAEFVQYMKVTAEYDRSHVLVFDVEDCSFIFGEFFHICDRGNSIIILDSANVSRGEAEVTKNL